NVGPERAACVQNHFAFPLLGADAAKAFGNLRKRGIWSCNEGDFGDQRFACDSCKSAALSDEANCAPGASFIPGDDRGNVPASLAQSPAQRTSYTPSADDGQASPHAA